MGTSSTSALGHDFGQLVEQSCRAAEKTVATLLSELFQCDVVLDVKGEEPLERGTLPEHLAGPCCFVVLEGKHASAILAIPCQFSFAPSWFADDEQVANRLGKHSAQFGILLPHVHAVVHSWAIRVENGHQGLRRAGLADEAHQVLLEIRSGDERVPVSLVWPCQRVERLVMGTDAARRRRSFLQSFEAGLAQLPPYMRSLLRVRVTASVVLASARMPLARVLELAPGTILSFSKPCDETLELQIGDQTIAKGEAVRVGSRFGLWITSMALPQARFHRVVGQAAKRADRGPRHPADSAGG
ncbi:MAG: hypothetical protein KatS3mg110_4678 [Pirellulaceae bacterium]|nr:MAG: hypothetical protein KatS3mg110_4678 [Pirellulaceae bacterium]